LIRKWRQELVLAVAVLLTIGALLGEHYILQTRIDITPADHRAVEVLGDAGNGGNSTAKALSANGFEWECTLADRYAYPFCEMDLMLGNSPVKGLNLRNVRTLRIWLDYQGPGRSVRLYLRNFDPRYSNPLYAASTKFNQVELPVEALQGGAVDVMLSDFFVADWWIASNKLASGLRHPQFDNVVTFEIQTGSAAATGRHHFKLRRVELIGQSIPTETWYLMIVIFWVLAVILYLAMRIASLRTEVRLRRTQAHELAEVNELLDRHSRELEEKTKRDHLTGAFNRHGVEEVLQAALRDWRSERKPTSVVLMDIDHFKQINDQHGHGYGDYVLAEVSRLVSNYIREKDLFARWGGEEFLLICRNTSLKDAQGIAEKIRLLIARHVFDRGAGITASFGVATLTGSDTLEQLFHAADQALYLAKDAGRNRVVTGLSDTAKMQIASWAQPRRDAGVADTSPGAPESGSPPSSPRQH
jgi:diguanylate cyclase (GGDEF)-like protein